MREQSLPATTISSRTGQWHELDTSLRSAHAARTVGQTRTVAAELSGQDGLSEDFLTLKLSQSLGAGLHRVRVDGMSGSHLVATVL
jgi:hypothetical protein